MEYEQRSDKAWRPCSQCFLISASSAVLMSSLRMSRLTREKGFTFKQDGEHGFRRVVASPAPLRILEATAIKVCHAVDTSSMHAWRYASAADILPAVMDNRRGTSLRSDAGQGSCNTCGSCFEVSARSPCDCWIMPGTLTVLGVGGFGGHPWLPAQVLLQKCFTAICAGGGGIPVVVEAKGGLSYRRHGVEAVIDKVGPHRHPSLALHTGTPEGQLVGLLCTPSGMVYSGKAQTTCAPALHPGVVFRATCSVRLLPAGKAQS